MKKDIFIKIWSLTSGIIVVGVILFIFLYILFKGYNSINFEFIFGNPKGMPLGTEGGIFPAIAGSLYLGIIVAIISSIFSIGTAIYLCFYSKYKKLYDFIIFSIQSISGIPSIVIGLFGYSFLIVKLGMPKSLLVAGITVSIMIVPFITLRVEKIFSEFTDHVFVASLNLGVSKIYTIYKMVIPFCFWRIISVLSLSVSYAIGAAAPIMFTGAVLFAKTPTSIMEPFMALPYHLYGLINEGISIEMAYGTSFVLLIILIISNLFCKILSNKG
ncbi:MAG: ABC transporter permease subunit [Clostridium sp.]